MGAVKKKNRLGHRDRSWKIFLAVMAVIALIPLVYALIETFSRMISTFSSNKVAKSDTLTISALIFV